MLVKEHNADLTIVVAGGEAFAFAHVDDDGRITSLSEKPTHPDSNLASMGIYIFSTELCLRRCKKML